MMRRILSAQGIVVPLYAGSRSSYKDSLNFRQWVALDLDFR